MIDVSRLEFQIDDGPGAPRVTPLIDGRPLPELVKEFEVSKGYDDPAGGYAGLIPSFFRHAPLHEHFFGTTEQEGSYLLGCECGEVGCWPIVARIEGSDDTVSWRSFVQPYRPDRDYSDLCPLVFDRKQYEAALQSIAHVWGNYQ